MPRMNPSLIAQIISEVEKNPILYDYTLADYKNTHQKNLVWTAIAKQVGAKNGDAVSWKWRNLRDSYSKYKKHLLAPPFDEHGMKTGLINWRWAPLMTFLDPYMRKPKEFLGPDFESLERETERPTDLKRGSPEIQESSNSTFCPITSSSKSDNANHVNITNNTVNKYKRKRVEAIDEVTLDPFPQESSPSKLDMTDYLFLNYAETFKRLSRKRQAVLKLNMAKMFATAELEELESDPIELKVVVDDSD